ncbi:MAG: transposase [Planctomycetaceae bacterium]|nr:transposase [Planctomycetaceae bacterium]
MIIFVKLCNYRILYKNDHFRIRRQPVPLERKAVDETRKLDVAKLQELLGYNLRMVRAYLMKEEFERFWQYKSSYWAGRFLHDWCVRTMRSKIEPMKKFVGTIRNHRDLLLHWFKSQGLSSGIVEGFNNKVKLTLRKGYGYASNHSLQITLYHALGKLPEPDCTHRFW